MPGKKSDDTGYQKPTTISQALANFRYRGKIVVETPEGLYSTNSQERAVNYIKKMKRKYPDDPPVSTVIPQDKAVTISIRS